MTRTKIMLISGILLGTMIFTFNGKDEVKTFTSNKHGFSFLYPKEFLKEPLQGPAEVIRFSANNPYRMPVMVATVGNREDNTTYETVARSYEESLEERIPQTSGFELLEQKPVTLYDGTDAGLFVLKWVWVDGSTVMYTVGVIVLRDKDVVTLSATVLEDPALLEVMAGLCFTLDTKL